MHRILMLLAAVALFALTASGCSDSASTTSAPDEDLTPPTAPVNLSVSVKGDLVTVAWRENSELDLASYRAYRAVNTPDMALASSSDLPATSTPSSRAACSISAIASARSTRAATRARCRQWSK